MKIIHSATYDFKLKYEIKQVSWRIDAHTCLLLSRNHDLGRSIFVAIEWKKNLIQIQFKVRDFIDDIGDKNYSFYFNTNNKESIYRSIEYRTSQYKNWTSSNVYDLSKWLKKRLNIKERWWTIKFSSAYSKLLNFLCL